MINKLIFSTCVLVLALRLMSCRSESEVVTVVVTNELALARTNETITLPASKLKQRLPNAALASLVVQEVATGQRVVSQLVDYDLDVRYEELLFQTDLAADETKTFQIHSEFTDDNAEPESKVYAKFVPTRKDDFAWENDRIAFRMYGPALQAGGEISSGVDVWVKSVRALILDKWYEPGNDYHTNHGEGLDYYKVGPSRGCGGVAMWDGQKLYPSDNFSDWKIVVNGPIRIIFELSYAPWNFEGRKVSELKRVTLDAGQNLNRFESIFNIEGSRDPLEYAIGIVKREGEGRCESDATNGWLGYWEPGHEQHGNTGCGIFLSPDRMVRIAEVDDHYLVISKAEPGKPAVYYAGAGWSKSGDFPDADSWMAYLEQFSKRLQSPLKIEIQ